MKDEQAEFSKRLVEAMRAMGLEARASVLLAQFNLNYRGRSVRFETASRWLTGRSIPRQDKLVLLAKLLRTDPQTLRYGKSRLEVREPRFAWPDRVAGRDQKLFEEILALPVKHKKLVRELVDTLMASARGEK